MAHYALLNEKSVVIAVITGRDEHEEIDGITDWEAYYTEKTGHRAIRTSYNTKNNSHVKNGEAFRAHFAGVGYTYDEKLDAFLPPRPNKKWLWDEKTYTWLDPNPPADEETTEATTDAAAE